MCLVPRSLSSANAERLAVLRGATGNDNRHLWSCAAKRVALLRTMESLEERMLNFVVRYLRESSSRGSSPPDGFVPLSAVLAHPQWPCPEVPYHTAIEILQQSVRCVAKQSEPSPAALVCAQCGSARQRLSITCRDPAGCRLCAL
jgi:hypothetical protein